MPHLRRESVIECALASTESSREWKAYLIPPRITLVQNNISVSIAHLFISWPSHSQAPPAHPLVKVQEYDPDLA